MSFPAGSSPCHPPHDRSLSTRWLARRVLGEVNNNVRVVPFDAEAQRLVDARAYAEWQPFTTQGEEALALALERIPRRKRLVFVLRYVHDLTPVEIAAVVGIPAAHVSRLIYAARLQLREQLAQSVAFSFVNHAFKRPPFLQRHQVSAEQVHHPVHPVGRGARSVRGDDDVVHRPERVARR